MVSRGNWLIEPVDFSEIDIFTYKLMFPLQLITPINKKVVPSFYNKNIYLLLPFPM